MNLTGTRPWVVGGVVAALVLVALTWLLAVGPARSEASSLRDDTAAAQTQNDVLLARTSALRQQAEDRTDLEAALSSALASLPTDPDLPALNRELAQHAEDRGVEITSVTVGSAVTSGKDGAAATAPAGMLQVPVTVETSGARTAQLFFLRDLQQVGPRAALVSSVALGDDESGETDGTTMTVQLTVFAAPLDEQDAELLADVVGTDAS